METVQTTAHLRLDSQAVAREGFAYGVAYPSLVAALQLDEPIPAGTLVSALAPLEERLPPSGSALTVDAVCRGKAEGIPMVASFLLQGIYRLQQAAGLPIHASGQIIANNEQRAVVAIPSVTNNHEATANALAWLVEWINLLADGNNNSGPHLDRVETILNGFKTAVPGGSNVPRFLKAAHELNIPTQALPGGVYQFGQGARSRRLDSSFTDETPLIAAKLSRNKQWAAAMLRRAGLPVPEHQPVATKEQAVEAAQKLGYPVVVKPADQDGGMGVAAGLQTDDAVEQAFLQAQRYSNHILVEKHVEGRDYRVTVFQDDVIWAIERVPGSVTGDGQHTVAQLVEHTNADPRRGEGPHSPLKYLRLDDEATSLLAEQGLNAHGIPACGRFIRLRRTANVATGGTPIAVHPDSIHSDNRLLAVRAAAALHLDLAGIDLLIPDIRRSWKETGAAICEVNGQPQLGAITSPHIYGEILGRLVQGNGRIPIALVLGAAPASGIDHAIAAALRERGHVPGLVSCNGVTIGTQRVRDDDIHPYSGGQILMQDQAVSAIVLDLHDDRILRTGLPFDRFDVLVLAGPYLDQDGHNRPAKPALLKEMLTLLLPCCHGTIIPLAGSGLVVQPSVSATQARWLAEPVGPQQAIERIMAALATPQNRMED